MDCSFAVWLHEDEADAQTLAFGLQGDEGGLRRPQLLTMPLDRRLVPGHLRPEAHHAAG
jgi:hypothetical protein